MTGTGDEADPTVVPFVVVDDRGRRRVGGAESERAGSDLDDGSVIDLRPAGPDLDELTGLLAAAAVGLGAKAWKLATVPLRITGGVMERAAQTSLGGSLVRALQAALDDPASEGRSDIGLVARQVEERLAKVVSVVVPVVVQSIDVDVVLDQVDFNEVIERVDLDQLIAKVDVDALIDRVDVEALLAKVDVDALMARIDVDALLDRMDVDAFLGRIDLDAVMARVDIDAILDRVDVDAIVARAGIEEIVARSTVHVADSTIDLARRQAVGVDAVMMRLVDRVLGRDPQAMPQGPQALIAEEGRLTEETQLTEEIQPTEQAQAAEQAQPAEPAALTEPHRDLP